MRKFLVGLLSLAMVLVLANKNRAAGDASQAEQKIAPIMATVSAVTAVNTVRVIIEEQEETVHLAGVKSTGYEVNQDECEKLRKDHEGSEEDKLHFTPAVKEYRSQQALGITRKLLDKEKVRLYFVENENQERLVLMYRVSDNLFVNHAIVNMGYAQVDETIVFTALEKLQAAQQRAAEDKRGLWGASLPSVSAEPQAPQSAQ
jgi:Staphylococcal nuclease homologue